MGMRFLQITLVIFVLKASSTADSTKIETKFLDGAYITRNNAVLISKPLATKLVKGSFSCVHECLKLPRCFSLNYETSAEYKGKCEMFDRILSIEETRDGSAVLQDKQGFTFMQMVAALSKPRSCLEYLRAGVRISGIYDIYDSRGTSYKSICDFTSEPDSAWTLIMSEPSQPTPLFKQIALSRDLPLHEQNPDFRGYRLSLARMKDLRSVSTHWRITCSFPTYGVDYRDYVRARFSDFDLLTFSGRGICKRVEFIDVMGHNCTGCTAPWWQVDNTYALHHDTTAEGCEFGKTPGIIAWEDVFGYYHKKNPNFRCVSEPTSTTNHWIGGYL